MKLYLRCIPKKSYLDVFSIDYDSLSKLGIKYLFFDLDNTLVANKVKLMSEEIKTLFFNLKTNFKVIIASNNNIKRVKLFASTSCEFLARCHKPFIRVIKRYQRINNISSSEVAFIGDQLYTDINVGSKCGFYTILVKPIAKSSDAFSTKISRSIASSVIKKIKRHEESSYITLIKDYV
jgi:HAD superfamily phosphatase (TIGR01668 family)